MTYLLLPSSRLALYLAEKQTLRVLPIRAEEYLSTQYQQKKLLAVSYFKSLSFYSIEALQATEGSEGLKPLAIVNFNKKIEGLTANQAGICFISDKFGDIYSIDNEFQQRYLNSNLGIPTFLKHLQHQNKKFIAVGDEDTRIKIYNQSRMHEIISFWFLIRRVPLQMLQTSQNTIVLLVKKQHQINLQMQEDLEEFVELYVLEANQLTQSEFQGKLFYISKQQDEGQECKYQSIIHSKNGNIFLLKLFSNKIAVISFTLQENHYSISSTNIIAIESGEWDYLYSQSIDHQGKQALLISYGKSYNYDQTKEVALEEKTFQKKQGYFLCHLNKDEHLIVYYL